MLKGFEVTAKNGKDICENWTVKFSGEAELQIEGSEIQTIQGHRKIKPLTIKLGEQISFSHSEEDAFAYVKEILEQEISNLTELVDCEQWQSRLPCSRLLELIQYLLEYVCNPYYRNSVPVAEIYETQAKQDILERLTSTLVEIDASLKAYYEKSSKSTECLVQFLKHKEVSLTEPFQGELALADRHLGYKH